MPVVRTSSHVHLITSLLLAVVYVAALHTPVDCLRFADVSRKAGLRHSRRQTKYGGAAVADLDGDGYPDLLFGHHDDGKTEIYFNNQNGTFKKGSWGIFKDTHGINPFRFSPWHRSMHFSLSPGGSNGKRHQSPLMFKVDRNRRVREVTVAMGIHKMRERCRSAIFVNLSPSKRYSPDVVFTNVAHWRKFPKNQRAFRGSTGPKFKPRELRGFANNPNWYGTVTDVDGDGLMEIVSFHQLNIHRVTGPFLMREITRNVLPQGRPYDGTVAVAELDFDNDGRMDLYVARTNKGDLKWLQQGYYSDYLLRNVGGRYEDWTKRMGILRSRQSRGVTVGDFNNDGFIDILVTRWQSPDVFLMNDRGRRFVSKKANFKRSKRVRGDMATAVDFDRDGRLDVVLSEGHTHNRWHGGHYRLMRNMGKRRNYLLVRVGNSPRRTATSLHATVRVWTKGLRMIRRVGSPGTAVSNSYIELVHFGLGSFRRALRVTVRWSDGVTMTKWNVRSRKVITFGRI